jgi:hypothetical protein
MAQTTPINKLVRWTADRPLVTDIRNGLHVVRLSRRSPKVTTAQVNKLRKQLP